GAHPRRVRICETGRRGRYDDGARARVRRPRPALGGYLPVHPRRVRLAGRRPFDDQLPSAAFVAAAPRRRVRRAEVARALRPGEERGVSLPLVRRRDAPRPPRGALMTGAPISVEVTARAGGARATTARTPRGQIRTPCFMPVGTRAAVKHLTADDLRALGVQVVLANTYHLMLRPGEDAIASFGGLHRFMSFAGHVLTDSGGFQVLSLSPQVDDDGVTFRSVYDGSIHRLTPER